MAANFLRTQECISLDSIDIRTFRFLRWSWTWSFLTVGGTLLPHPAIHPLKRCGKRSCHWRLSQKSCWVPQPSPFLSVCQFHLSGGHAFFDILLLFYIPVEALPAILSEYRTILYALPRPPVLCLCICFIPFTLTSSSLLSHSGLLPSLPNFLVLRTATSCTLLKTSLCICQLHGTPLSLKAVSQGIRLTISLKSW